MFTLQSDGMAFVGTSYFDQGDKTREDQLADCATLGGDDLTTDKGVQKRQRSDSYVCGIQENEDDSNDIKFKKAMHKRDVERQRRQKMAGLYASLRSLLLLEFIKGKRSTSDHMEQAVNYIKHMQGKIEEMQVTRDKLKQMCSATGAAADSIDPINMNTYDSPNCVKVNLCRGGMEILIRSSLNGEGSFPLSKVLAYLLGRGLNLASCVSARVDACHALHKIQANDFTGIDLLKLQHTLVKVINFGS